MKCSLILLLLANAIITNDSQVSINQSGKIPNLSDLIFYSCVNQIKEKPSDEENKKLLLLLATPELNKWPQLKKEFFNLKTYNVSENIENDVMIWSISQQVKTGWPAKNNPFDVKIYYFGNTTYYSTFNKEGWWISESYNSNHFVGICNNKSNQHYLVAYEKLDKEYVFKKNGSLYVKCSRLTPHLFYLITASGGVPTLERYDFDKQCSCTGAAIFSFDIVKPESLRFYETANSLKYILLHPMFGIWEFDANEFKVVKKLPFKAMRCKTNQTGTLVAFSSITNKDRILCDIWICSSDNLETPLKEISTEALQIPKTLRFMCYDKYLIVGIDRPLFEKVAIYNIDNGEKFFETEEGKVITHNPINIFQQENDLVYIRNGYHGWFSLKFPLLIAYEKAKHEAQVDINQNN